MVCHGFGTGTIRSSVCSQEEKRKIAEAISRLGKVAWAHVVCEEPHSPYDLVFEMREKCLDEIKAEVETKFSPHSIEFPVVTIVEENSYADGAIVRHPPK
ncbi:hypothetical protein KAU25_04980 [Candidatus Bathyarchaeota archaeon]|nr:hypothetical protein [Candidatus Bathyarchaeota archaeon]